MAAIVIAFAVCIIPRHAVRIFMEFSDDEMEPNGGRSGWAMYQYLAYLPYPLHVAINPIIYSLVDHAWRHEAYLAVYPLFSKCPFPLLPFFGCCRNDGESGERGCAGDNGLVKFTKWWIRFRFVWIVITDLCQGFRRVFTALKNLQKYYSRKRLGVPTLGLQIKGDQGDVLLIFYCFLKNFKNSNWNRK